MATSLETALARLEELGGISDSPTHLVRTFLSPASRRAAEMILGWMSVLGMEVSHTPDGTLRGILPGKNPAAKPLLLGSHYDTVIDAGKYDGPLGIVSALAALADMELTFPVHVLAFSDEEGTRFQTTYLGSRGIVAPLDHATLAIRDAGGVTLAAAIEDHGWHEESSVIRYARGECRGYVEIHIEQGRLLEAERQPACVVTSIAGQSRLRVTLTGHTDHAGTTPMPLRRDALTGAAACILVAEALAKSHPPLVATVGKIEVHPGASNSVPQRAVFTVDFRHPDDAKRRELLSQLSETFHGIAADRSLKIDWEPIQENDATPCDPVLTASLIESLTTVTGSRLAIASGAGHDGVAVAAICPIAMLFIRCREGLSHHPDEFASPADIGVGIEILSHFLKSLQP